MDLLTEEEQMERLRNWLRSNGLFLVVVVLVSIAALVGWRWWLARSESNALAASAAYEKVLQSFDANDIDGGLAQIEQLRADHASSGYVVAADLAAVRLFVSRNEFDKAEVRLKSVLAKLPDENLRPIVLLRLARVQSALGRNDDALATLGTQDRAEFEAAFAEARGDVRLAKGDREGALKDYQAARAAQFPAATGAGAEVLLDLKINELRPAPTPETP